MTSSSPRQASCVPVLLCVLALACNPPPSVTTPDPPQVTVSLDETNVVGRSFPLSVSTSGCEHVKTLEVLNNETVIKQVSYGGNPTAVTLDYTELTYGQVLAASLSLSARVACDDGRTNVSQGQVATFFPADDVVTPFDDSSQVVPNYFVAEGSGTSTAFIGCMLQGNRSFLYRVTRSSPSAVQSVEMGFPCDETTIITERRPAGTGVRWVWTPGKGALVLGANFKVLYTSQAELTSLTITPDGGALVYNGAVFGRVDVNGKALWSKSNGDANQLPGPMIADPVLRTGGANAGTIVVAVKDDNIDDTDILVVSLDYNNKGTERARYTIDNLPGLGAPAAAFDATGSVLYLGTRQAQTSTVRACALGQTKPCTAGNPQSRLWINDTIPGSLIALIPYANNNRLAALTSNRFWFMDLVRGSPTEGRVLNKDQQALSPSGALVGRFAQPGKGEDFYMFNSAPGSDTVPNPPPVEVLAMDTAEQGLVYRYLLPGGENLSGAVDDSGALWLRVGRELVKPFSLSEYRRMP